MAFSDRQKLMINFCLAPRTIEEMAGQFSCSYHTARNDVLYLQELGIIKKSLFPKNRHYTFQTAFKTGENNAIEHINFYFKKGSFSPVTIMQDASVLEGANRAARVIQLAIAKLLYEYDMPPRPGNEREEKTLPRSTMVRNRVKLASEYLRGLADLADQVGDNVAWENSDFVRLFYGPTKYSGEELGKMMDELTTEAQQWPEFQELLKKMADQ